MVIYTLFHFEKEFKPIQKTLCIFFSNLLNFLQIKIIFVFSFLQRLRAKLEKKKPHKVFQCNHSSSHYTHLSLQQLLMQPEDNNHVTFTYREVLYFPVYNC